MDKIENAKWLLERALGWIASADIKAGFIVTIDIALIGGLAAATSSNHGKPWNHFLSTSMYAAILLIIVGIGKAVIAVFPRTGGPNESIIYFGKIADLPVNSYIDRFVETDEHNYLRDLLSQVHRNSEIALEKHRWVKSSAVTSSIGGVFWVISLLLLYWN